MPFLIPLFAAGAGAGAWAWWSSEDEEPSFEKELFGFLRPFAIILLVILALKWLHKKGIQTKK
jgi:hypothetical protein